MKKQRLILICGFAGSGKTAAANMLHETFQNSALISADELCHIRPFELDTKLGRIKMKNCTIIINNFLSEDFENIICEGLVWSQEELDAMVASFGSSCSIVLFWLAAEKPVRQVRIKKRGETDDFLTFADRPTYPWPLQGTGVRLLQIHTDDLDTKQVVAELQALLDSSG